MPYHPFISKWELTLLVKKEVVEPRKVFSIQGHSHDFGGGGGSFEKKMSPSCLAAGLLSLFLLKICTGVVFNSYSRKFGLPSNYLMLGSNYVTVLGLGEAIFNVIFLLILEYRCNGFFC